MRMHQRCPVSVHGAFMLHCFHARKTAAIQFACTFEFKDALPSAAVLKERSMGAHDIHINAYSRILQDEPCGSFEQGRRVKQVWGGQESRA